MLSRSNLSVANIVLFCMQAQPPDVYTDLKHYMEVSDNSFIKVMLANIHGRNDL